MSQSTITRGGVIVSGKSAHLTRRLSQLYVGLTLYGVSAALLVRAGLGLEPWGCCTRAWRSAPV